MPFRFPSQLWSRTLTSTTRSRATLSPQASFSQELPSLPSAAKLGRVGKWYLPTMALIAVGTIYAPSNAFATHTPSQRTVTLDSANRQIGYAITTALEEQNNRNIRAQQELSQTQRNQMLLDAYGARSSLEELEKASEMLGQETVVDPKERNRRLMEAYGEKTSLRDLEKAMQIYEVQ